MRIFRASIWLSIILVVVVALIDAQSRFTPVAAALAKSHSQQASSCPRALDPSRYAAENVIRAVRGSAARLFGPKALKTYQIESVTWLKFPAGIADQIWPQIAVHRCGSKVAAFTWFVVLRFPGAGNSNAASGAHLYVSRTPAGWKVWLAL